MFDSLEIREDAYFFEGEFATGYCRVIQVMTFGTYPTSLRRPDNELRAFSQHDPGNFRRFSEFLSAGVFHAIAPQRLNRFRSTTARSKANG